MTGKEEFFQLVNEGRIGHNIGLSTGSKKLDMYADGYLPCTSYLIGGASGTGNLTYFNYFLLVVHKYNIYV